MRLRGLLALSSCVLVALTIAGCSGGGKDSKKARNSGPPRAHGGRAKAPIGHDPYGGRTTSPATATRVFRAAPTTSATWTSLAADVKSPGSNVGVVIVLRTPLKPEGFLTAAARKAQRKKFRSTAEALLANLDRGSVTRVKRFDALPLLAAHVDARALAALRRSPFVASVSKDRETPLFPLKPPKHPRGVHAAGESANEDIKDWWDFFDTNEDDAHNNGWVGTGQTVAILDDGTQAAHPWLAGRVVEEACFSDLNLDGNANTADGTCPNNQSTQYGAGAAAPCTYTEMCVHGTHVAGIAAGKYGMAPAAKIIAVDVFHPADSDNALVPGKVPNAWDSDVLKGMDFVARLADRYPIAAVNLSLGSLREQANCDNGTEQDGPDVVNFTAFTVAAQTLLSKNVATVVASGNDGYNDALAQPACHSSVISVGNTTLGCPDQGDVLCNPDGQLVEEVNTTSNSAGFLSLLAPGTHVCSSIPVEDTNTDVDPTANCNALTGTSMAAPHVAGAFALLRQYESLNNRRQDVATSLGALQSSGVPVEGKGVTKPRIDVWAAINMAACGRSSC